jgi:DNA-binding IclR family transcriptional regulator
LHKIQNHLTELTPAACKLYLLLLYLVPPHRLIMISMPELAKRSGLSARTIHRALHELERSTLLTRHHRPAGTTSAWEMAL